MKRYAMVSQAYLDDTMQETEDGFYTEAAPALAWKRYALALKAVYASIGDTITLRGSLSERDAAHAALVALGEVDNG